MKIYTKTGDGGSTSLFGGKRISKASLRIAAYGTVDELNSFVGLCLSHGPGLPVSEILGRVQSDLFRIGAELASPDGGGTADFTAVSEIDVRGLESAIDAMEEALASLKHFILPGGHPAAAAAHVARSVCRRAERLIVELSGTEGVRGEIIVYMNRLSDALFVAARTINAASKRDEVAWVPGAGKTKKG